MNFNQSGSESTFVTIIALECLPNYTTHTNTSCRTFRPIWSWVWVTNVHLSRSCIFSPSFVQLINVISITFTRFAHREIWQYALKIICDLGTESVKLSCGLAVKKKSMKMPCIHSLHNSSESTSSCRIWVHCVATHTTRRKKRELSISNRRYSNVYTMRTRNNVFMENMVKYAIDNYHNLSAPFGNCEYTRIDHKPKVCAPRERQSKTFNENDTMHI